VKEGQQWWEQSKPCGASRAGLTLGVEAASGQAKRVEQSGGSLYGDGRSLQRSNASVRFG